MLGIGPGQKVKFCGRFKDSYLKTRQTDASDQLAPTVPLSSLGLSINLEKYQTRPEEVEKK